MTKLHEILAVEQGLGETANRITKEVASTLANKKSIFAGLTKEHEVFAEDKQHLKQSTEIKEVESTVDEQLSFMGTHVAQYWDVSLQKEAANQKAVADIVVDNVTLAFNVPSIVLLGLEKKLTALLSVYNAVPTLDAAKAWEEDPGYSKRGVFRTKHTAERQQAVTNKVWKEVSAATVQHKAQIVQDEEVEVLGKYTISEFSGAISSFDKAEKLSRLTALIRAVKTARQRANGAEVDTSLTIGSILLDYING